MATEEPTDNAWLASKADTLRRLAALQAENEQLKREVTFKDELIWTSRVSDLYQATVAAEKRVKELEVLAYVGDHHFPDLTWKARALDLQARWDAMICDGVIVEEES